ncbi:hypothetical protein OH76DRAFT_1488413 [Lentinus brumalis]|uniref:Uncharacterized protein n=1 Tax=Lentinus brumalis TaxID=2498619 RepID=A0A371CR30_9APHY|nr:hypothetical protein OH76DRAFT_1488413 [Polyporus brumalis]
MSSSSSDSPRDTPSAAIPGWESLTPPQKQGFYYAETGKVCIGPVGAPVSGLDRLILKVIQEEVPGIMNNWFEDSYLERFYTTMLTVRRPDPSAAHGPRYALFRGICAPAILSTWPEVARAAIGVPGSLYQKCSSHIEASLRLVQAWQIGGINARISLGAVLRPSTTELWLEGFASSTCPHLHIPEEDELERRVPPACSPDGVDELLDADAITGAWETYVPGRKPAKEYTSTMLIGSLPPLLTALHLATSADTEPASAGNSSSTGGEHGHYDASLTAISSLPSGASEALVLRPRAYEVRSSGTSEGSLRRGYVAVIQGEAPWVYADRDDAHLWIPPQGSGHVGYYLTLGEALHAFRMALRTREIHG